MKITGITTFTELCEYLAHRGGGYTLWIGAGASVALTKGATPLWSPLVDSIAASHGLLPSGGWAEVEMADRLERISQTIGHAAFRRELRTRLVDPIYSVDLDEGVFLDQAIIGSRASSVVTFNVEMLSGMVFVIARGGSAVVRPYRRPLYEVQIDARLNTRPGPVTAALYCPHGALDLHGTCVMTRSEYDQHGMTMAATAAVNACFGGDLIILGMSMTDRYLREAIRDNRRHIDRVYWVDRAFPDVDWTREARVQCIPAEYSEVWSGLATAHVTASTELASLREHLRTEGIPSLLAQQRRVREQMPLKLDVLTTEVLADGHPAAVSALRQWCLDLGVDVPPRVLERLRELGEGVG
jgi:hypothetical protein